MPTLFTCMILRVDKMQVNTVIEGDCMDVMRGMPDNCIDSIVTDPPYELTGKSGNVGFMGKKWDASGIAFNPEVWHEGLRIAKPGATLMAFGGTRTHHRLACAIEDAGWEIRDCINYLNDGTQAERAFMASLDEEQLAAYLELHYPNYQMAWVYGQGIGLGHDVSKAADKRAGKERRVIGKGINYDAKQKHGGTWTGNIYGNEPMNGKGPLITAPATPLAAKFNGWKSRLKGAYEIIIIAQKPMGCSFAENAAEWGIAGLNIDGCRVPTNGDYQNAGWGPRYGQSSMPAMGGHQTRPYVQEAIRNGEPVKDSQPHPQGRYPANTIHSGEPGVMAEFAKAGVSVSSDRVRHNTPNGVNKDHSYGRSKQNWVTSGHSDTGTPARYFAQCPPDEWPCFVYQAKAGKKERGKGNNHPTVKPLSLVRYLVRLTRPPDGGVVLDMFGGSGTTALACLSENRDYILIEKEPNYVAIANRRIAEYTGREIEVKENDVEQSETVKQLRLC